MADMLSPEKVAAAMFKLVKDAASLSKKYKAMDLQKAMKELFPGQVDKKLCKEAIKLLINEGRCVYTYFGGSYIELPHVEGSANPDPE